MFGGGGACVGEELTETVPVDAAGKSFHGLGAELSLPLL